MTILDNEGILVLSSSDQAKVNRSGLILLLTMATLLRALQHEPIEPVWSMGGNLSVIVLGEIRDQ